LIKRAGKVKTTKAAYLVKACKPQQDKRIDLPAIGLDTIQQLKDAGLAGVAVEAGKSIIINKQQVLELADKLGIFVYGVK